MLEDKVRGAFDDETAKPTTTFASGLSDLKEDIAKHQIE